MRILIETSGGGGVVLLIALALLAGHGGGVSAALAAVVIALVVAVVLAVAGFAAYLVYRLRNPSPGGFVRTPVVRMPVLHELPGPERPALEPVRLHPEQLAELAEILRRSQRPE